MARETAVGIIGIGAMGRMLVDAHFAFGPTGAYRLSAASRNAEVLADMQRRYPSLAVRTPGDLVDTCRVVFVCVPPLPYLEFVRGLADRFTADKTLVCISNGVELDAVARSVEAAVVKVIPSMTHSIGRGVSLVTAGPRADEDRVAEVERFIRPFALPVRVSPADMRVAANLTGCGPAIFAHFMRLLVEVSEGAARELSSADLHRMVRETFCATARLIEDGVEPERIAEEAATGGGMTEIALETLTEPLRAAVRDMTAATLARETELKARSGARA